MLTLFNEGKAKIYAAKGTISSKLEVFYNPAMKLNRDICIYIINKLKPKTICEAMAASGVRAIRLALETDSKDITANEANLNVIKTIEKNVKLNKVENKVKVTAEHAQVLLRNNKYDYVDIDPFGPPTPYIEDSLNALNKNSILALTATDTSCLCGRYVKACERKYHSRSLKCGFEKEIGLRIIIATAQLIALEKNISLIPIFSHSSNHYLRTYLQYKDVNINKKIGYLLYCPKCLKRITSKETKEKCCNQDMLYAGPLWLGNLWDKELTKDFELIKYIKEESEIESVGFYDTHKLAKVFEKSAPKIDVLIEKIKDKGYKASRTHFKPEGIRTNAPLELIKSFL
ncbi:MAG: tRNA (guanine(26)-N(2))-dimethyltransferase [Nanoarchaeota archaeon]|nr:tRNA (guanine(26)-N(2))-dimethyltransferase [Nanoarchaeota archaeon]